MKESVEKFFLNEKLLCSEIALKLILKNGGVNGKDFLPFATGFGSGVSRNKGQCGAISGAILGLGYFAGRKEGGQDYELLYALVGELHEEFVKRYGTADCFELTGCDFNSAEDMKRFSEEKIAAKCVDFTAFAAECGVKLLKREKLIK